MKHAIDPSRRRLLKKVALVVTLTPIVWGSSKAVFAADAPLVMPDDPTGKALKYTPDASKAAGPKPGSTCANCSLYQGATGAEQGGCLLFPGKSVKAAGWCASWAPKTA